MVWTINLFKQIVGHYQFYTSSIDLNFSVNKQNQREWFPKNTGGNPNFYQEHQVPRHRVMIWIGVLGKIYVTTLFPLCRVPFKRIL